MSSKVTYGEIIEALSAKTGFSKNKSEAFTKALIRQVKQELEENGKASITNFGSFKVKEVAERQGQNPQTGEPITIPAHKRVTFSPYKALRETVNAKYAHLESELIEEEPKSKSVAQAAPIPEKETEEDSAPTTFERKKEGSNNNLLVMILSVLVIAIIGIASAWFFMSSGEKESTTASSASSSVETGSSASTGEMQEDDTQSTDNLEGGEVTESNRQPNENQTATARGDGIKEMEIHTVQANEWYWVISKKVYGKSQFWPLIFQQNFDVNHHPDSLEKGTRLAVPSLQGKAGNLTRQDYQNLYEAGMMVSEAYQNAGRADKAREYAQNSRKWQKAADRN